MQKSRLERKNGLNPKFWIQDGEYDIWKKSVGADNRKLNAIIWDFIYEIYHRDDAENVISFYLYCTKCKTVIHNPYKNGNTNKF